MMRRPTTIAIIAAGATSVLVSGCGNRAEQAVHQSDRPASTVPAVSTSSSQPNKSTASPAKATVLPVTSPLTRCTDSSPDRPKPINTALARDFSGNRVQRAISLDGGKFRVRPPRDDVPRIPARLAFCNLLAGATANNSAVLDAASEDGLSFGLGVVTVSDSVLEPGSRLYDSWDGQRKATLRPYHARLAWLAVTAPEIVAACPAATFSPGSSTAPVEPAEPRPTGYQILAIDADTGADGILYSTTSHQICSATGIRPPSVAPAVEFVSLPWTLVRRGPGPQSASITYLPRSCDDTNLPTFTGTGRPVVDADRDHPGLVRVSVERTLTTCGRDRPTPLLLRSSTIHTDLPRYLVHARVGAEDVTGTNP